jgi:hypothetical protein
MTRFIQVVEQNREHIEAVKVINEQKFTIVDPNEKEINKVSRNLFLCSYLISKFFVNNAN